MSIPTSAQNISDYIWILQLPMQIISFMYNYAQSIFCVGFSDASTALPMYPSNWHRFIFAQNISDWNRILQWPMQVISFIYDYAQSIFCVGLSDSKICAKYQRLDLDFAMAHDVGI
jgi:hypothetical protein